MATGDGVTEWIDVADFTPGIHSGTRSFATGTPESATDGVAQVRDTWGCVANPNGGLEAAPALVFTQVYNWLGSDTPLSGAPSAFRVLDFDVTQKTYSRPFTTDSMGEVENPNDSVWVLGEHFILSGSNSQAKWRLYNLDRNYDGGLGPLGFGMSGTITLANDGRRWGTGRILFYRDGGDVAGTAPALGLMAFLSHHDFDSAGGGGWVNTARTRLGAATGSPFSFGEPPFRSAYHQQRTVFSVTTPAYSGSPTRDVFSGLLNEDSFSDEQLRYSPVLDTPSMNNVDRIFVADGRPDHIGAMLSVNTNELYIVKAHSGGMIVSGALERPSVNRYPGVASAGDYPHVPVLVPELGMVYGSSAGVFAWAGGNQSRQLSASLDGTFWLTPEDDEATSDRLPQTPVGKFAYLHPFIYAPNNWVMDVRTGGWFRLHPTTDTDEVDAIDLAHFAVSGSNRVYASPSEVATPADPFWVQFNPRRGASKYSWRSQPIARQLRGRQLEFRELNAVVSGHGTIDVSLVGLGGDTQTRTIEVDSDQPVLVVKKYDLRAFDIEVLIQSEGAFIPEVTAVGTLKLESAADVGGGYRSGALASDPVVPGLKVAAPQRFDTGVTFTGTSFPAAQTLPDDDASGWTSFGAGQNLSFQLQTPNAGIPAGTISCWIIRYDVQTAAGDHVGYLYKQAYYTSTMTEVGTNSHTIHVWYRSSGTGLLTGPQSQASNRTWAMDRLVDGENRQPAPTMHRFSLGYKPASVANRN